MKHIKTSMHPSMNASMYAKALRGAVDYARADRSDPFTFSRVMSHIQAGMTDPRSDGHGDRKEALYGAETLAEERFLRQGKFSDGSRKFFVLSHKNMVRP